MSTIMQNAPLFAVSVAGGAGLWMAVGFLGQVLFGSRFLCQWIVSELKQESTVPLAFWHLSLAGGAALLAYAIHRRDPVFIVGQAGGLLIYARNLALIHKKRGEARSA